MEFPTKKDIEETIESIRQTVQWLKGADPNDPQVQAFVDGLISSIDDRPLARQPELTPKQRSQRLFGDNGTDDAIFR